MTKVRDLHQKWMKSVEYREAYEALTPEFELARAVIDARVTADLTQEQLAKRMETTQSVIARLENGRTRPSTQALERLAAATGTRLKISFETAARGLRWSTHTLTPRSDRSATPSWPGRSRIPRRPPRTRRMPLPPTSWSRSSSTPPPGRSARTGRSRRQSGGRNRQP